MSNLLEQTRCNRSMCDLKSALQEIGIDVENINDLSDVANSIRNDCQPVGTVVNATPSAGRGIRVTPVDRKGYKISANSDAMLTQDLTDELCKGTSVHKVLYRIIHHMIPNAIKEAIKNPYIVSIEVFKAENDGIDYYDNRAFGSKGQGRKSGLHPFEWYLKIYTMASVEPIYVGMGCMIQDLKREFLYDAAHQTERLIAASMSEHMKKFHKGSKPHKPHRPGCSHDHSFNGFDPDDDFNVTPEEPGTPGGDCPICDKDESFGGFDPDDDFMVEEDADDIIDNLKA